LAAYSDVGYQLKASYALFWHALEWLAERVSLVSLGGAAGISVETQDGLARFKQGWATETRLAYLCGRVLHPERYAALAPSQPTDFFPAYRQGVIA
jgi:hypothetical protein